MSNVNVWNKKNLQKDSFKRFFPTDMMLRALLSERYFNLPNKQTGGCLLDVGCLFANNLVPFSDRGWKLFGTEVTDESVEIAQSCCAMQQLDADVKLGINTRLPFDSKKFDVLLSLSTIHYEETLEGVDLALREFSRVINDDGVALIQTVAPKHDIFLNSTRIDGCLYQLDMEEDIRHLQKFIFFANCEDFIHMAKKYFGSIEVARCTEDYPNSCIDFWLFKLGKRL